MNIKKSHALLALLIVSTSSWVTPVISAEVPEARADKGLVVFYRLRRMGGAAIPLGVQSSQGMIGTLNSGSLFYKYLDPGEHTFWSEVLVSDSVTVNVLVGQTYYIRGYVNLGFVVGRPKLTQMSESEAKQAIAELK